MLKRSKLLIALLVVTVVCASVGFAAVADTLQAGGSIEVNVDTNNALDEEFEGKIKFTGTPTIGGTATLTGITASVVADADQDEADKISLNIPATAFTAVNQTVTVTATVDNSNTTAASLAIDTANTTNALSNYVGITMTTTTIPGNSNNTTIVITFTLNQVPATTQTGNYLISITATPVVSN